MTPVPGRLPRWMRERLALSGAAQALSRRPCAAVAAGLVALSVFAAQAASPAVPAYREFKDWIVACDNVRRCEARLAPAAGDTLPMRLLVAREAGPAGAVGLDLAGEKPLSADALRLDGAALTGADRPAAAGSAWTNDGEGSYRLQGEPALEMARRLEQARQMAVQQSDGPLQLSLDGLAAALRFIDDVQGRVGTLTALHQPGAGPVSQVPAAPALPVVQAAAAPTPLADTQAFAAAVRTRNAALVARKCDAPRGASDDAMPLTDTDALVLLRCWSGAYQSAALVLRVPRSAPQQARPVALPDVPGGLPVGKNDDPSVATEAFYDPATATLSSFAKSRGIGDCGIARSWVFDGTAFQPASRDEQRRCAGSPGDWPALYRTRSVPATATAAPAPAQ
ncbi:DUF1176 domain-containing protein [Xylophilus ampelinus]|uniref:Uncharacterized protein DUF1176 n=1 Tax=Xylophilus ampelinus TaxID=54067 RepID=A0A318SPJ9_9BURK|nr:DUF1176 domain-containing protein [Xylophilus ampelinus]MCS4508772.1 DUF1176 domain-containing protein [Xylophilus ampelinus]PYE79342.1 uncharacterized protein DUF1176 [Xylophilus ampelinus]